MLLDGLVVLAGAGIVIGAHAVTGYKVHRWLLGKAPDIASLVPRDGGAILGILAGALHVWWWFFR